MQKFQSCAEWEEKHGFYKNTTKDVHTSKEAAEAVCKMLEKEGLGGERIHFPLRTFIEEWKEIPTPNGYGLCWVEIA